MDQQAESWNAKAATIRSSLDPSVDPCADFYAYACDGWKQAHPWAFLAMVDGPGLLSAGARNEVRLWKMLTRLDAQGGGPHQGVATFYRACLTAAARDSPSAALDALHQSIDAAQDRAGMLRALAALHQALVPALFTLDVIPDPEDPAVGIVSLDAPPLGLPNRDWYLYDNERNRNFRNLYTDHITRMLALDGRDTGGTSSTAENVVEFEKRLVPLMPARMSGQHRRGPAPRVSTEEFAAMMAPLPVNEYFAALGLPSLSAVSVSSPEYFRGLARVIEETDPAVLRDFLRWQLLHSFAGDLPSQIRDEHDWYERTLLNIQPPEAWEQCGTTTELLLGDEVTAAYLEDPSAAATMAAAQSMAPELRDAVYHRIDGAQWMTPATRAIAGEKVRGIAIHLGHPATGNKPAPLAVSPTDHLQNVIAARHRWFDQAVAHHGEGGPSPWAVRPFLSTGLYRAQFNDALIPLGLLQPPVFDRYSPDPVRYGTLGVLMSHEMFHALDARGREFDAHGRAIPWWDDATQRGLDERTQCLFDHFGQYDALPGRVEVIAGMSRPIRVDAMRTANENLADVAGVAAAYDAYRAHTAAAGESPKMMVDLSNDRLFFIAYAQLWCGSMHPGLEAWLANNDDHAPLHVRVNGVLSQVPGFAEAFGCPTGSPMRPPQICSLW